MEKHHRAYFFTKSEDWSSEIEYRWVLRGADTKAELITIDDSLCGIVLGADYPKGSEAATIPFARRYGAHVARLAWRNGTPLIVPGPYSPDA